MKHVRVVSVVVMAAMFVMVLTIPAAAVEKTVQEWWGDTFDTTMYPYPGDGTQVKETWTGALDAHYLLKLEETGWAATNVFGVYDATTPGVPGLHQEILSGSDGVGGSKSHLVSGSWGYYIHPQDDPGRARHYTEDAASPGGDRFAWVFDHPTAPYGGWIIAFEDRLELPWTWDSNDMIVSVERTPEPASAFLLLLGAPVVYWIRRREKTNS